METYAICGVMVGYVIACIVCYFDNRRERKAFIAEIHELRAELEATFDKWVRKRDPQTGKFKQK